MNEINYNAVELALSECNTLMSAAEAHGTLTGMICSNAGISSQRWLGELFDEEEGNTELTMLNSEMLSSLFEQTRYIMGEESFEFDLLLPDDQFPLADRAIAFGEWCRGFLYGIGAYYSQSNNLSDECSEVLRDISEISRLDSSVEEEEDESAFMELTEYVRVGVQLIFYGINTANPVTETFH